MKRVADHSRMIIAAEGIKKTTFTPYRAERDAERLLDTGENDG